MLDAVVATGLTPTAVTFEPHPRTALGNRVELICTLERRLELLDEAGVAETLVVRFDLALARMTPAEFAEEVLRPIGTEVVAAGPGFRFGHARSGDLGTLADLGFETRSVEPLEGVSSTAVRALAPGGRRRRSRTPARPSPEVDGTVVAGDARGGTLGFPTANLSVAADLLVPAYGIYAGSALEHRAAISIGTNPHYGGEERRIEAFLLDFAGDLYGRRVVVEVWERLRDERAFESEGDLIAQIAGDVEQARPPSGRS